MKFLRSTAREIAGLFVDDKFMAAGIVAIVATVWLLNKSGAGPAISGAVLPLGCLAVLIASALSERRE
jgi:hypothetical protein